MKKKTIYFNYFLLIFTTFVNNSLPQESPVDWTKLETAWKEYIEYPSSENALKVYSLLPERIITLEERKKFWDNFIKISNIIFDNLNFSILEYEIYAGERNAVKVAFRLYSIADGANDEILTMILTNLIRIHPKLYLEELKVHMHSEPIKELGWPVGYMGGIFVDRFKAQDLERKLRIKALESVKDKELMEIRDKCIEILQKRKIPTIDY